MGWQDDLRDVVVTHGAELQELAEDRLAAATPDAQPDWQPDPDPDSPADVADPPEPAAPEEPGLDPASVESLFDSSVVAVFTRRSGLPATAQPSIRIVVDDRLDALAEAVRREIESRVPLDTEQERTLAEAREAELDLYAPPAAPRPGRRPGSPGSRLGALVAAVRSRRRARVLRATGVVTAVALVAAAVVVPLLRGGDKAAPSADTISLSCPTRLTLDNQAVVQIHVVPGRDAITASSFWPAAFRVDGQPGLAASLAVDPPTVWLTDDSGQVVALGTAVPTSPALRTATTGPAQASIRFESCATGGPVPTGSYHATVDQTLNSANGQPRRLVSDPVGLTVIADLPAGYQPAWLSGSPLACGESITDLQTRVASVLVDDVVPTGARLDATGARFTARDDRPGVTTLGGPRHAQVLWVQNGRVVGVGADDRQAGRVQLDQGDLFALDVPRWDTTQYCAVAADGSHPDQLPPGTYQVVPYARYIVNGNLGVARWFLGTGITKTVVVTPQREVQVLP